MLIVSRRLLSTVPSSSPPGSLLMARSDPRRRCPLVQMLTPLSRGRRVALHSARAAPAVPGLCGPSRVVSIATCAVHPPVTGESAVTTLACCVTGSDPWAVPVCYLPLALTVVARCGRTRVGSVCRSAPVVPPLPARRRGTRCPPLFSFQRSLASPAGRSLTVPRSQSKA